MNLTQKSFEMKYKKKHMIYRIRYLAVYIASLKVCKVCNIFRYKQQYATLHQKRCYV